MAARTRRAAHFSTVDALTELDHFSCCAFRNGKRGRTGLWMRTLWRLCGHLGRIAGRSPRARTWPDLSGTAFRALVGAPPTDNPADASPQILRNIAPAVRSPPPPPPA